MSSNHDEHRDQEQALAGEEATADVAAAEPAGVDQEIVATFEAELAEARRQADEHWDRYLRAEAELDNLKKRAERRLEEALAQQRRQLFSSFLEVLDNLERALAHGDGNPAAVLEGVEATYRELSRFLAREGVEPIKAMDQPFDPAVHEAVAVVPLPAGEEERVVGVDRQGYTLNGELLRPARVLVGQPSDAKAGDSKAAETEEEANAD